MNERREHERYPLVVGTNLDTTEPKIQFGLTQDFSRSGARLLTQARYAAGMSLRLNIFISERQEVECEVEVIRCIVVRDQGMWTHEIAVKTKELLDDEIVDALLEAHSGE